MKTTYQVYQRIDRSSGWTEVRWHYPRGWRLWIISLLFRHR